MKRNMYYPLAGMNYVIDDLSQIVANKINKDTKEIELWLSAQVNCYPHVGTLTNFISSFAIAKLFQEKFGIKVKIVVELLESVTGEEELHDGFKYYKNLNNTKDENGKTITEKYLPYFTELLDRLKSKDNIDYEILFFYEYQQRPLVKKALVKVINNRELLKDVLSPKGEELRVRFGCPVCGLTDKHNHTTRFEKIEKDNVLMKSECPCHGEHLISINEKSSDLFDINVPLRYLVKIMYLMDKDKQNNTLSVIVDGGDWSGMWPLRVYMEPLLKMNYNTVPSIIYTPTILDWSGSKLSKRMYVGGNKAYREFLKEGLINYSKFYEQYGEEGFDRYYSEINNWVREPKKFIRDYTIDYIDCVITGKTDFLTD